MPARVWLRSVAWVVAAAAWATPVTRRLAVPGPLDVNVVRGAAAVAFVVLFLAWHRGERGFLPSFWPALGLGVAGAYGPILLLGWLLLPAPGVYEALDGRPGLEALEIHTDGRRLTLGAGQARREVYVEDDWDGTVGSCLLSAEGELLPFMHCRSRGFTGRAPVAVLGRTRARAGPPDAVHRALRACAGSGRFCGDGSSEPRHSLQRE